MEDAIAESDDPLLAPGKSIDTDFAFMSGQLDSSSVQAEASKEREERQAEAMKQVLFPEAQCIG